MSKRRFRRAAKKRCLLPAGLGCPRKKSHAKRKRSRNASAKKMLSPPSRRSVSGITAITRRRKRNTKRKRQRKTPKRKPSFSGLDWRGLPNTKRQDFERFKS